MVVRTDADGRPELTFDNAFPRTYASVVKTERRIIFKRVSKILAVVVAWVSLALLISFGLGPSGSKPPSPLLAPAPAFAPTTNQVLSWVSYPLIPLIPFNAAWPMLANTTTRGVNHSRSIWEESRSIDSGGQFGFPNQNSMHLIDTHYQPQLDLIDTK